MITDIASYLRFFDSLRRRTERDVAALPPLAAAWRPPAGDGEAGWSIGEIVGHLGSSRLYFASTYRGEGWIAGPPEVDRDDQRTWVPWLQVSAERFTALVKDTPSDWLTRRIETIDTPGRPGDAGARQADRPRARQFAARARGPASLTRRCERTPR